MSENSSVNGLHVNGHCPDASFLEPGPQAADSRLLSQSQVNLLSELKLEIKLELAAVQISAAELLDLQPGQKLGCEFEPDKELTLTVGDEVIGKGKLVLEGDEVLLEIVALE